MIEVKNLTKRYGDRLAIDNVSFSVQRGEIHSRVPGEWLLPYVHQRYDDLSPLGSE